MKAVGSLFQAGDLMWFGWILSGAALLFLQADAKTYRDLYAKVKKKLKKR